MIAECGQERIDAARPGVVDDTAAGTGEAVGRAHDVGVRIQPGHQDVPRLDKGQGRGLDGLIEGNLGPRNECTAQLDRFLAP